MKKNIVSLLFSVIFLFALSAEQRTALVIGNATYRIASLRNPSNDARDMSAALQNLGFSVTTLIDANNQKMYQAIRDFGKDLARGRTGLFYYAGHGMQVGGRNYLIPVDADIRAEDEVRYFAVDAGLILSKMESAGNETNIVILDACRDNPFKRSFRSSSRGLAVVEAPKGSLVIYATAPGSVAAEGRGRNGVFTAALLKHMKTLGVEIEAMLKSVRSDVIAETVNDQIPWSSSSLTGSFYLAGRGGAGETKPERKPTFSVEKAYGSVRIEVKTAGALYLNGTRQGQIPDEGMATLSDLEVGSYSLEMRYTDGKTESKKYKVKVPVAKFNGDDVAQSTEHAGSVPVKEPVWLGADWTGVAPTIEDVRMTVSSPDGATITYPKYGTFTSLHHSDTLVAGETDTARALVDASSLKPGTYTLYLELTYTKGNDKKSVEGKVAFEVTG